MTMMNESSSQSWSCGTCTYVNKPMFLLCEMCAQRRPNSGPAPPVRQPSFQSDMDSINGLSHNSSDLDLGGGVDLAMIETMDSIIIGSTGLGMDAPTPDATRDNDRAPRRVQRHNSSSRPYLDDDDDGPRGTLIMTDDPANYPSQDGSAYKKTAQELAYEREAERAAMQEAARSCGVPVNTADPSMEASISHQQLVCTKRNRNSSTAMNASNQTLPTAHMGSSSTGFSGFDRNSDHSQQQQQHMDASRNSLANHRRQHRQQQQRVGSMGQPHPPPRQPQHVRHHQSLQSQLPAGNGPVIHWSSGRSCASEVSSICSTINSRFDSSCDLSVESDSSSSSSEVMAIPRVIPRRVSRPTTAAVAVVTPTTTTKRPQQTAPHASSMRNLAVSTTNARPVPRPMKRGTSMATGMSTAATPPVVVPPLLQQQSSSPGDDVPSTKKNHPRRSSRTTTTTTAPAATRGAERLKARAQARANMLNKLSSQQNLGAGTSTRKLSDRLSSSQTILLQQQESALPEGPKIKQRTTTTTSRSKQQQQQQPKKRRGIRAVMATMRISAGGGKSRPTN